MKMEFSDGGMSDYDAMMLTDGGSEIPARLVWI
jgi:hypothetical protein